MKSDKCIPFLLTPLTSKCLLTIILANVCIVDADLITISGNVSISVAILMKDFTSGDWRTIIICCTKQPNLADATEKITVAEILLREMRLATV